MGEQQIPPQVLFKLHTSFLLCWCVVVACKHSFFLLLSAGVQP
jgi:hypothetical protein